MRSSETASPIVHDPGGTIHTSKAIDSPEVVGPENPGLILIVDDDAMHRALVVRIVSNAGFKAQTAEDGEQAWEALTRSKYDLLITDHEMPKLKGLDLIERLRGVSDPLPCILISGSLPKPESSINKTVRPGAFLPKPFKITVLIETIFGLLGRKTSVSS